MIVSCHSGGTHIFASTVERVSGIGLYSPQTFIHAVTTAVGVGNMFIDRSLIR